MVHISEIIFNFSRHLIILRVLSLSRRNISLRSVDWIPSAISNGRILGHIVRMCAIVNAVPQEPHCGLSIRVSRCSCVSRVWPVLNRVMIICCRRVRCLLSEAKFVEISGHISRSLSVDFDHLCCHFCEIFVLTESVLGCCTPDFCAITSGFVG